MKVTMDNSVKPGLASDALYSSKLAELHALKTKESETRRLASSLPHTKEISSSGGSSATISNKQSAVSGPPAGSLPPQNPSPEMIKRLQRLNRGGGTAAAIRVPSPPSRQPTPDGIEAKTTPKTANAQFFNKNQVKSDGKTLMLVTVNVIGSTGPLRFLVDAKDPVSKVIELALKAYLREGRLPHLGANHKSFELFCANSNFEALDPGARIGSMGARQFLLHRKQSEDEAAMEEQNEQAASFPWKIWMNLMNTIVCSH